MPKNLFIFLTILTSFISHSQYNWTPGKLILKNGDTLKGFLKLPMHNISTTPISLGKPKLEYRKGFDGKKEKFTYKEVSKVFFGTYNSDLGYYEYVRTLNQGTGIYKIIRNGKVKLYVRTIKFIAPNSFNSFNKKVQKIKQYCVIRDNERIANPIEFSGSSRTFKNFALRYFSDCPEVISYIENDLYENFDIVQIVDDYNLLCEQ